MSEIYDGHTSTLTGDGSNSGWAPEITDITPPTESSEEIDTSHLQTATARTKIAGALTNNEDLTLTINTNPGDTPVIAADNETWTLTFPLLTGELTAAKLEFSGFVKSYAPGTLASNSKLEGTVTLTVSGNVTYTDSTTS